MCRKLTYSIFFVVVLGFVLMSAAEAADPDLVGWWKFEEASGTLYDQSDNHNDGTVFNGVLYQQAGQAGYALGFDGTDDYVVVGTTGRPTDTFSFGGWLKTSATHEIETESASGTGGTAGQRYAFDPRHGGDADGGAGLSVGTNGISVYEHGSSYMPATAVYSAEIGDDWNHIMVVYHNKRPTIYFNGNPVRTGLTSPRAVVYAPIQFGGMAYGYFEGLMDEIRIYSRVLSPAEIRDMAFRPKAYGPDPPDGATGVILPMLDWEPGTSAKFHNVYLGTNPTPGPAELLASMWMLDMYWFGAPGPGLDPGTTYYWRIDEVEADTTTIYTGDVWSFTAAPYKAYNPQPPDGARYVSIDADLSWLAGATAITHDVYFGTVDPPPLVKAKHPDTTYEPGTLNKDTTYYWRIDERNGTVYPGDIWRFTTLPDIPVTDPDLLGWWKLDEGSGTIAVDWSGHGNHGTLAGDPQWVDGYDGGALEFDGSGDYVDIVYTPELSLNEFTVSAWVNIAAEPGLFGIHGTRAGAEYTFDVKVQATNIHGDIGDGAAWIDTAIDIESNHTGTTGQGGDLPVDTWYMITYVIDNTNQQVRLYLDADLKRTIGISGTPLLMQAGQSMRIGHTGTGTEWMNGLIDDVRIYSKALTQDEIKEVMRGDPLLAWNPNPPHRSITDVEHVTSVTWSPGDNALQHDVYFSTDRDAVEDADSSDTTGVYRARIDPNAYTPPGGFEFGQAYYWRVDEYNTDTTISKGRVWGFAVAEYLIVEDFESYDDFDNRIYLTWIDGYGSPSQGIPGNGTGSTVGHLRPPYAEQIIVHGGRQAMPMDFNNVDLPYRSEAVRTFDTPQDWTRKDVKSLTLWFRGLPASFGSFSYDPITGIYTVTVRSGDIWGNADSFRYVYKTLSGPGAIQAKVIDVTEGVAEWTKVGVMIREDLEPNSPHAFSMLTPPGRTALQHRATRGDRSDSSHSDNGKITFPYWVKIERVGNSFTAYYSDNGSTWIQQPNDETLDRDPEGMNPANIPMNPTVYIGLALCSNNTAGTVQAQFSDVTTTGTVTGVWQSREIGIASNDAEQLYVVVEDSATVSKAVKHPDPDAVLSGTYQEWNIDLAEFAPVDLKSVKKLYIGLGDRDLPTPGGTGSLYVDDIRIYKSRCVPSLARPAASFDNDCVVDYLDLDIMTSNWLVSGYDVTPDGSNLNVGLIGQYRLNGNLNDSVGGNHGTKEGVGAAVYVAGMDGQAIDLDGIDDHVSTDVNAIDLGIDADTPKTVTAWAYTRSFNGGGIFDMGDNVNGRNYSLRTLGTTDIWRAQRYGYPTYDFDFEYDSLGKWVHFALVYGGPAAGDESWAYADGNLVGSQIAAMDTGTARNFEIGVWSGNYFDGLIDEVRVYNRALTQAEVASLAGRSATFTQIMYPLIDPMDSDSGAADMNGDSTINLKDYALLADTFLDEKLWP